MSNVPILEVLRSRRTLRPRPQSCERVCQRCSRQSRWPTTRASPLPRNMGEQPGGGAGAEFSEYLADASVVSPVA